MPLDDAAMVDILRDCQEGPAAGGRVIDPTFDVAALVAAVVQRSNISEGDARDDLQRWLAGRGGVVRRDGEGPTYLWVGLSAWQRLCEEHPPP